MKAVVGFLLVCVVAVGVIVQMLAQLLPIVLIVAAVLVAVHVVDRCKTPRPRRRPLPPSGAARQPVGWVLTPVWRAAPSAQPRPYIDAEVIEDPRE